jgi:hypothetical protein
MSKTTHFDQLMQVDIGLIRGKVSEVVERGLKESRIALPKRERFTVDASWHRLQLSRRYHGNLRVGP